MEELIHKINATHKASLEQIQAEMEILLEQMKRNEEAQNRLLKGIEDNDETHVTIVAAVKKLMAANEIRLGNIQTWVIVINIFGAVFGVLLYILGSYDTIIKNVGRFARHFF